MPNPTVCLKNIIRDFSLDVLYEPENCEEICISVPDVIRPGLQLAGYYDHFSSDRIQLIGNMEMAYLSKLSAETRRKRLDTLFSKGIPCLIMTRGHEPYPEFIRIAKKRGVPLLRTPLTTSDFMSSLVKHLNVELAPRLSVHGVLVEVNGEGILILGDSGVGKSETALEIVKRGHRLIADDQVEIRRVSETTLLGRAPEIIRHLIEIRGIGIIDVKELFGVSSVKVQENINFVINLELWDEKKTYDRLGINEETTELLGISIPSITIPVGPGRNLAIIVEAAAINFRVKKMGYNAAKKLIDRVFPSTFTE